MRKKKPEARWRTGDFVRVKAEGTTDVPLSHHGEIGVIIEVSVGRDHTPYYKVWFGPNVELFFDPRWNWRGFYEEWVEDVGHYLGGGKFGKH